MGLCLGPRWPPRMSPEQSPCSGRLFRESKGTYIRQNLLRASAVPLPVSQSCGSTLAGSVPNNTSGWGNLNVKAAYDNNLLYMNSFIFKSFLPLLKH